MLLVSLAKVNPGPWVNPLTCKLCFVVPSPSVKYSMQPSRLTVLYLIVLLRHVWKAYVQEVYKKYVTSCGNGYHARTYDVHTYCAICTDLFYNRRRTYIKVCMYTFTHFFCCSLLSFLLSTITLATTIHSSEVLNSQPPHKTWYRVSNSSSFAFHPFHSSSSARPQIIFTFSKQVRISWPV